METEPSLETVSQQCAEPQSEVTDSRMCDNMEENVNEAKVESTDPLSELLRKNTATSDNSEQEEVHDVIPKANDEPIEPSENKSLEEDAALNELQKSDLLPEVGEDAVMNGAMIGETDSIVNEVFHDDTDNLGIPQLTSFRPTDEASETKPIIKDSTSGKRLSTVVDIDQLARSQHATEDVAEVKSFTIALLELAYEKQTDISSAAIITLQKLARKHPATVLRTLHSYLSAPEGKPSTRVRTIILATMEMAVTPAVEAGHLDFGLATSLAKLALDEMVSDSVPDIELPSSNILVSVGAVYCKDVILLLSPRLQMNSLPHPSVLKTLASLATFNIYGTVPHLKGVLDSLVALLTTNLIKSSTLRGSFATALAKFSEALLFYLANMERAPDVSVHREWFSENIAQAFEILYLQWLPCKTTLTCQEILEALGQMSQLLSSERLEQVAMKLLSSLIQCYRGPVEPLFVNRCLALYLDAFFNAGLELSDTNLQELLQALFLQMTVQPDYSQPSTVKNHYEVLRCLERMSRVHMEKVVGFLLTKTEQPGEKLRVASLTVLKHLLNSLKDQLEPHVAAIGAQLKSLTISEPHLQPNSVRKALVQVIVAMAVQGHLLSSDTIHSGRHIHLIAYLLKLCTLIPGAESASSSTSSFEALLHPLNRASSNSNSIAANASSVITNDELKQMCENVIQLLVTTQKSMEGVFWPLLLRYSLDVEYNRAAGVIARALAHLVVKKRTDINTDEPSTAAIVARFLVLARSPMPSEKCSAILTFLQNYGNTIHPSLSQLWQAEMPQLAKQLRASVIEQPASLDGWRSSLEKLADATIARIKLALPDWSREFATCLSEQVGLYDQQPVERGFLFTLIGICVHHGVVTQGPSYALDFIMSSVRHQMVDESLGCALAMGWCSRNHLDVALLKLQNLERNDYGRRSSGFLGFMKESRSEVESDLLKATAARCYANIAIETPTAELLLKVDKHIIRAIILILQSSKDRLVRQESLVAVAAVARALRPDRLQERYILAGRPDLLKETLIQLKSTPLPDSMNQVAELQKLIEAARFAVRALDALAALVRLPPTLRADDQSTLVEAALERSIPLLCRVAMFSGEGLPEASLMANQLLASLDNFILSMLRTSLDPGIVDIIFSQLLPWTRGQEGAVRRIALAQLKLTLGTFVKEVEFEPGAPTRFSQGHFMIAKLVPRCTDPDGLVRDLAVDCIGLVLETISKYLGYSGDYEMTSIDKLDSLKVDFGLADPVTALTELADLVNSKTQPSDLWALLESMANALTDPFPTSSSGLSLVMCLILKVRGGEIHLRVKDLLDILLSRLKNIDGSQTRRSILNGVCLLAAHQRDTVATALLSHSLPHNEDISDCWKALAADPTQATTILDHISDILTYAAPYEERGPHGNEAIVSFRLLSAISALKSMCQVQQLSNTLQARFPTLFCVLMLAQSCLLSASPPIHVPSNGSDQLSSVTINREAYRLNPYQMAADAFKAFLACAQLNSLIEPLVEHRHWANAGDLTTFCELVANLTALCTIYTPGHLPYMIASFSSALKSNLQRHRLTAVAFYAEIIHQRAGGRELDGVIRGLTSALPDSSPIIRRIALKGLGALGNCDPRQWNLMAPAVLNALVDGLEEDGQGSTAREALEGLMRLVPVAPLPEVERLASRLALRVRPFFEHESPQVRQASISLLAQIFQVGSPTSAHAHLAEQVHTTLTSLLLHLNDSHPDVVRACKSALRQAGPLLDHSNEETTNGGINTIFQKHLKDQTTLNYSIFLSEIVKILAVNCDEWVNTNYVPSAMSYFKSSIPELRANAALYIGLLCGASKSVSTSPQYRNVSLSLTRLLHDPAKMVRLQAMNAICLMFG